MDTSRYYITLYPRRITRLHKILVHGADVIQHVLLPIGNFSKYLYFIRTYKLYYFVYLQLRKLSEELQECRNKDFKIFRQHRSRNNSMINNNEELSHNMLCVSSDPVVSSFSDVLKKK